VIAEIARHVPLGKTWLVFMDLKLLIWSKEIHLLIPISLNRDFSIMQPE